MHSPTSSPSHGLIVSHRGDGDLLGVSDGVVALVALLEQLRANDPGNLVSIAEGVGLDKTYRCSNSCWGFTGS
jgi:hypothetical protein